MSWFFSVALPAEPVGCHAAAATLRSVARAAAAAADLLDAQAVLPREVFSGLTAHSYRGASATLGRDSRGVAADTRRLAAALDEYADRVGAARDVLQRVREAAQEAGFRVTADDLVQWVPEAPTPDPTPYQRLETRASRAHREVEAARTAWWQAVHELTTGPLPSSVPVVPDRVDALEPSGPRGPRGPRRPDLPPGAPQPVVPPAVVPHPGVAGESGGEACPPASQRPDETHRGRGSQPASSHGPLPLHVGPLPLHWAPVPLHLDLPPLHWAPLLDPVPPPPADHQGAPACSPTPTSP